MEPRLWQVLVADLKSSRRIPERQRSKVDQALHRACARLVQRYEKDFRLKPQILRGDELQAVLRADAPALHMLAYLRAQLAVGAGTRVELRAGLGRGEIKRMSTRGPFASEGVAFHRARAALEAAKQAGGDRLTSWVSGDSFFDELSDAMLSLADAFAARWTVPQWEAIAGRIESKPLQVIARESGVGFQSVSKRLRAASWSEVQRGYALLERIATVVGEGTEAAKRPKTAIGTRAARVAKASVAARPANAHRAGSPSRG